MPHHLKATHRCHRAIDFVDRTDGYSLSPYATKSRSAARANGSTSGTPKNMTSLPRDCSLRASAVMGFKCPDRGMLTKPIFIAAPFSSLTLAAAQRGSGNDSRLTFSDEVVSCYKDTAELGLFPDLQMKGIPAGRSFIRYLTKQRIGDLIAAAVE